MTANVRDTREAGNGNGMWQDQDGWSKCNATTRVSGLDVDAEMHGHARREPARRRHAHRRKSTGATGLRVRIFENQIGTLWALPAMGIENAVDGFTPQVLPWSRCSLSRCFIIAFLGSGIEPKSSIGSPIMIR